MQVFETCAIAAHIERIEIVNFDMLAPVISLTNPKLGIWLAFKNIAPTDKGFPQAELIIAGAVVEVGITGRVRGVRLEHNLGLEPCPVGIVVRVQPIIDKNELAVSFSFVAEAIFRSGTRRLKGNLLPAL